MSGAGDLVPFLSGAFFTACLVASVFFLRFYKESRDRLFLLFSLAFLVLGFERVPLMLLEREDAARPFVFLLRLVAFGLIIAAAVGKNVRRKRP